MINNTKRIKFLTKQIISNPNSLLCAIEDITDVEFWAEDNTIDEFEISDIFYVDKRNSTRTDFQLLINVIVNNVEYKIRDWFTYNYKTKEFDLTNNYYLQFE